jgi:hypothetical protein
MKHVERLIITLLNIELKKLLDVRFISSNIQGANGFTKALSRGGLLEFQCNLNLVKFKEDIGAPSYHAIMYAREITKEIEMTVSCV